MAYTPEVVFLSAAERPSNIVAEDQFRAFPTYGTTSPVVCFSESGPQGVAALLERTHFQGWGIVVRRHWASARGGGSVWYLRDDVWDRLRPQVDETVRSWMVRTSPGEADWLHEREWRVPCPSGTLPIDPEDVVAILVTDPEWEPRSVPGIDFWGPHGLALVEITSPIAVAAPRWYWDGSSLHVLEPIPPRVDYVGPI